jgi:hypothetical protein
MKLKQVVATRRTFLTGLTSLGGVMLAGCSEIQPPTYGNVLRMGDLLTYKAHRLLLPAHALAREYERAATTSIVAIGTTDPADPHQPFFNAERGAVYDCLRGNAFAD